MDLLRVNQLYDSSSLSQHFCGCDFPKASWELQSNEGITQSGTSCFVINLETPRFHEEGEQVTIYIILSQNF